MLETVRIPGNQRVVGLKPGFNSKDHSNKRCSTPTPPLQFTRIQQMSMRSENLDSLHLVFSNLPFKNETMRSKAKGGIMQGLCVLCAEDAAILVLSGHTSNGCE